MKILKTAAVAFLLVLVFVSAWLFFRQGSIRDKHEIRQTFSKANSKFLTWRGAEIHYVEEGSGTPLLLIHGFGGHHRNFDGITQLLKNNYRVIRVDLPGFGLSDCPPVNPEKPEYVKLYHDFFTFFLDTLHLDSFYVAGNSMGGMVGWNMAVDHPGRVKKLVLLASAGYDLEKTAKGLLIIRFKSIGSLLEKGMPEAMCENGALKCYADKSKVNPREVFNNYLITNRDGNIKHMLSMACDLNFPDTALIKKVGCPTLIIWGKEDEIIPVAQAYRFKRDIPGAELVILENCGHVPMSEKKEETYALMRHFLNRN